MAATYSLLANFYVILHYAFPEGSAEVELLNYIAVWILVGAVFSLLLLIVCSPYRHWKLYPIPAVLVFFWWYIALLFPSLEQAAPEDVIPLTVATYNVTGLNENIVEKFQVLLDLDVDILGTQELTISSYIDSRLSQAYPYVVESRSGMRIWSRYPIVNDSVIELKSRGFDRSFGIRALIEVEGHQIAVYSFHPRRPEIIVRPLEYQYAEQHAGYTSLFSLLKTEVGPVILLCDCNLTDTNRYYRQLDQYLDDTWYSGGWGFGFTAKVGFPIPVLRGDFIWASSTFYVEKSMVWPASGGSDHYPVRAELLLVKES